MKYLQYSFVLDVIFQPKHKKWIDKKHSKTYRLIHQNQDAGYCDGEYIQQEAGKKVVTHELDNTVNNEIFCNVEIRNVKHVFFCISKRENVNVRETLPYNRNNSSSLLVNL